MSVRLVSKISNLCDPDPPTLQTDGRTDGRTDRRTTCNLNTALCTSASRGNKSHTSKTAQIILLSREATPVRGYATSVAYVVCLSVRLFVCLVRQSVTFRYRDHMCWNTSKIISRLVSLRFMLGLTPTWAIWCKGDTPKIRVE